MKNIILLSLPYDRIMFPALPSVISSTTIEHYLQANACNMWNDLRIYPPHSGSSTCPPLGVCKQVPGTYYTLEASNTTVSLVRQVPHASNATPDGFPLYPLNGDNGSLCPLSYSVTCPVIFCCQLHYLRKPSTPRKY